MARPPKGLQPNFWRVSYVCLIIGTLLTLGHTLEDSFEHLFQHCCATGESWARTHTTCTGPPDLQRPDHVNCLTSMYMCCVRTHRDISCENGKDAARSGRSCTALPGHGGMTFKDCCDACVLGIQAKTSRFSCGFTHFRFGSPWDEAYQDCCQILPTQIPFNKSRSVSTASSVNNLRCEDKPCNQICEENGNQIRCSCFVGFKLAADLKNCIDINECQLPVNPCTPASEICINSVGGFECRELPKQRGGCPAGYQFNTDKRTCDDVDECPTNPCERNQECYNTKGSFTCVTKITTCPEGFKIQEESARCVDVDECSEGTDDCDRALQICQNSHGSYECLNKPSGRSKQKCPAGFKWEETNRVCKDVDECSENLHDCRTPDYKCRNTMGGFDCDPACPVNQKFDLQQAKCISSSCSAVQNPCREDEVCIERSGFAHCVSKATEDTCLPGFKPTLADDGITRICADVNECEEFPDVCDWETETCQNEEGSYDCLSKNCPEGFHLSLNTCRDVDECTEGLDDCDPIAFDCRNTNGSFECIEKSHTCPPGYTFNIQTTSCEDIDECVEERHKCQADKEQCENVAGAYRCRQLSPFRPCDHGRRFNVNTGSCEDINECSEGSHSCDIASQECLNEIGSYRCISKTNCPHGFRWNALRRKCDDVNECIERIDDCDHRAYTCVNTVGSFQCQTKKMPLQVNCGTGFSYDISSDTCSDVNECEALQPCREDQICENVQGSYKCLCRQGYTMDISSGDCKDVNECQLHLHDCSHNQRCDNTIGSFACMRLTGCGTGYTLNAVSNQCEDDDECAIGSHNCGRGFLCRNTAGSFRCDRVQCPVGQKLLSDGTCKLIYCGQGKELDDIGNCIDVNECARNHVCRQNQRCINTPGSYRCQNLLSCSAGYELNKLGEGCVDVDECARRIDECGPNQTCKNRQGGYACECPRGFTLNNQRLCEDVDECVRFGSQVCASNSDCRNTQGSYTCECKEGFKSGESNKSCIDVDECAETTNICHQTCNNVWGSYQCSCKLGYTLAADQRFCEDVDECEVYGSAGNLCIGFCVNEPGSFRCSCPSGYTLSSDGRTCQDIDECQQAGICNDDKAVCLNTRGGFKCNRIECPPNYVRDKDHKNRCKRSRQCQGGASECLKESLSYSYNYITFVSKMRLPLSGHLDLFTMRGPRFQSTTVTFDLQLKDARGSEPLVTANFFRLRRTNFNEAMVSLVNTIQGPQEIELDLIMKIYHNGLFGGKAVAKLYIFVTQYEF